MQFDLFVGIDWSGARGKSHKGISVFTCETGRNVPVKIMPPSPKNAFSRQDVICYLEDISADHKVLAGIDFAFAYPVDDKGHYFPDLAKTAKQPQSVRALWQVIDDANHDADDFYGGLIWDNPHDGPYYNAPSGRKGAQFTSRRRLTEDAAKPVKSPSPTFNCVGPAGVGTGSLAGMRLCHYFSDKADIWPFDITLSSQLCLVEIFPSYYFKYAGIVPSGGAQTRPDALNAALSFFDSDGVPASFQAEGPDGDDADALIASAALRYFADDPSLWQVPEKARSEGWIFGVKSAKTAP